MQPRRPGDTDPSDVSIPDFFGRDPSLQEKIPDLATDLLGPNADAIVKHYSFQEALRRAGLTPAEAEAEDASMQHEIACIKQSREVLTTALYSPTFIRFWSRAPGEFVDAETGELLVGTHLRFEGTVRDWYGTMVERIFNLLRDHAAIDESKPEEMFFVCSPDIAAILLWTMAFEAIPQNTMSLSPDHCGNLFQVKVYKNPYFPVHQLMVGVGDLSTPGAISVKTASVLTIQRMGLI